MSDTSTQPQPSTSPAPSGAVSGVGGSPGLPAVSAGALGNALGDALNAAPELGQSPGIAKDVATFGGDVPGTAQATAHAANTVSTQQAAQAVKASDPSGGILGDIFHFAGSVWHDAVGAVSTGLSDLSSVVNKPLAQIQHEYRYLHDVEATHGEMAALGEGLGIAVGAIGGFAVTGGNLTGAMLGAEAATMIESHLTFRDSWERSGAANYVDPNTHTLVSPGRDLLSGLDIFGKNEDTLAHRSGSSGMFNFFSGLVDGIFDISTDPVQRGLAWRSAGRAGELNGTLARFFPTIRPVNGEDVEAAFNRYPDVKRAFGQIAGMSAGEIVNMDGRLAPIAVRLGDAHTAEDVGQVFKEVFDAQEKLTTIDRLPTMALTRLPFNAARRAIGEIPLSDRGNVLSLFNPANWAQRLQRLPGGAFQVAEDNPGGANFVDSYSWGDADSEHIRRYLHFGGWSDRQINDMVTAYLHAGVDQRKIMVGNFIQSVTSSMAFHDPNAFGAMASGTMRRSMRAVIDEAIGDAGGKGIYGYGTGGHEIPGPGDPTTGVETSSAISDNQIGRFTLPTLRQQIGMAHMVAGERDLTGKADDFFYRTITQGYFKPLVLLTPSYALHIALAELIPNAFRLGALNLARAGLAMNVAKLGQRVGGELDWGDPVIGHNAWKLDEAGNMTARRVIGGTRHEFDKWVPDANGNMVRRRVFAPELHGLVVPRFDPEEHSLAGLAWKFIGGDRGRAWNNERVQLAVRYIDMLGGNTVAHGLKAGENISAEVIGNTERETNLLRHMAAQTPQRYITTKGFATFNRSDGQRFSDAWETVLNVLAKDKKTTLAARALLDGARDGLDKNAARVNAIKAVKDWLDAQPPEYLEQFARHRLATKAGQEMLRSPHQDWAFQTVERLLGATTGEDGTLHGELLNNIANGDWTKAPVLDQIENIKRPLAIEGRELVPNGAGNIERIAKVGFSRVLNPMVNFLSREPIAFAEFERQWALESKKVEMGLMTEDEAMTVAANKTVNNVIRNVHNLHDRTQWTVTMRNFAPFYFAQEQAYRRAGRLLAESPQAFRKYQLAISGVHNVGSLTSDGQGNSYTVFPGTGWLAQGLPSVLGAVGIPVIGSEPVGMGWSLSSANVIFPLSSGSFRPEIGPVVAIPLTAIAQFFPELSSVPAPIRQLVTGGASAVVGSYAVSQTGWAGFWDQVIPNSFVQRIVDATSANNRAFQSSMMQTFQALDYEQTVAMQKWTSEGHSPTAPGAPQIVPPADASAFQFQQFIDRVRNQTRITYIARALIGLVTPFSPEVSVDNYGFPQELTNDINKAGGSVTVGVQNFLAKNPDAVPYTVFQSYASDGSTVAPPSNAKAEQWITDNLATIQRYPAMAWLMPQIDTKGGYSQQAYNEQIAQGFRTKFSALANPEDPNAGLSSFLGRLYVAAGNTVYFPSLNAHLQAQANLTGSEKTDEEAQWSAWEKQQELQNPLWAEWKLSGSRETDRIQTVEQLNHIFDSGLAPPGEQTDNVRDLLASWNAHQAWVTDDRLSGYTLGSITQEDASWQAYLVQLAKETPTLTPIIQSVFVDMTA